MNLFKILLPLTMVSAIVAGPEKHQESSALKSTGSAKCKGLPTDFSERFNIRNRKYISKKLVAELKSEERDAYEEKCAVALLASQFAMQTKQN